MDSNASLEIDWNEIQSIFDEMEFAQEMTTTMTTNVDVAVHHTPGMMYLVDDALNLIGEYPGQFPFAPVQTFEPIYTELQNIQFKQEFMEKNPIEVEMKVSIHTIPPPLPEVTAGNPKETSGSTTTTTTKIGRAKKKPVPEELKDEKYWERRRKNTDATRRCRERKKLKIGEIVCTKESKMKALIEIRKKTEEIKKKYNEAEIHHRSLNANVDRISGICQMVIKMRNHPEQEE